MITPISPEAVEDRTQLIEAINDRLEELDRPLPADRVLVAVPDARNDSPNTVLLDLQSILFDLIGNTENTITLDGDAIFGGDSWDEMTGGGNTTLHKHDIYGELAENETVTGDWTFQDTLDVIATANLTNAVLRITSSGTTASAHLILKSKGGSYGYSAVRLQSDEATDYEWQLYHNDAGNNLLNFGYGTIDAVSPKFVFSTGGDFTTTSITIAANTLDTTEWAYLDGLNQSLATTDTVQFDKLGINSATVPHGGVGHANTGIALDNRYIQMTAGDDYPQLQLINVNHDAIYMVWDAYWDGSNWKSSDAGSNYMISKSSDGFHISYDSGVSAGDTLTWNVGLTLNTSGDILFNLATHPYTLSDAAEGANLFAQTSDGSDSSSFAFGGGGSGAVTRGGWCGMRGNEYAARSDERGTIFFVAGDVTSPVGLDGAIEFRTGAGGAGSPPFGARRLPA
jgi:hypothetical protein